MLSEAYHSWTEHRIWWPPEPSVWLVGAGDLPRGPSLDASAMMLQNMKTVVKTERDIRYGRCESLLSPPNSVSPHNKIPLMTKREGLGRGLRLS